MKISNLVQAEWDRKLCFMIRLALGSIFIYASIHKILDPAAFAEIIQNYRILPDELIGISALFLPWLELFVGIGLITKKFYEGSVFLVTILLLSFFSAVLFNFMRGIDIECGCFSTGESASRGLMLWYLVRDSFLLLLSFYLFFRIFRKE